LRIASSVAFQKPEAVPLAQCDPDIAPMTELLRDDPNVDAFFAQLRRMRVT
jgi:hypothetical protein